ncbi:hypothetical protein MASR1M90_12880 [Desulfovibrionales bacterium]
MNPFLSFLREQVQQIASIETDAQAKLHDQNDPDGYRHAMSTKASLLAALPRTAAPHLDAVPMEIRPMAEHRLDMFASSAKRSLEIGSVFFMSALLYPEDHQPGQPNDLERWLHDLEQKL